MTRPVTGDVLLAALSWVSSPLRTEHSPLTSLPPATLVGLMARLAGRMPLTVPSSACTGGDSGFEFDPAAPEAAGTSLHSDAADGSEPPSRLCRTLGQAQADRHVGQAAGARRRRVPVAVHGRRRRAARNVDVEQAGVDRHGARAFDPVGEAVAPAALGHRVLRGGRGHAGEGRGRLVGHGLVEDAVERQAPVPDASAIGALVASASEPPPANCRVLRRSSETKPPLDCTLHWLVCAPAVDGHGAQHRHGHQPHRGDPDPTPHPDP